MVQGQITISGFQTQMLLELKIGLKVCQWLSQKWPSGSCFQQLSNLKRQGIIRRDKGAEVPHYYNFSREVEFGEKYSLFLQSVKPEDAGAYECYISANVGSQNLNLQVNLTVGGKL